MNQQEPKRIEKKSVSLRRRKEKYDKTLKLSLFIIYKPLEVAPDTELGIKK